MRAPIPLLALLLLPALAHAAERRVTATRGGCTITAGDREDDGTELIVADCVWPVAPAKVIAVFKATDKHDDYLSSVEESTRLPDGRYLQIHVAAGISDRQITLDFKNEDLPGGGFRTSWARSAKQEPLRDGLVDVPRNDGSWEAQPDGAGGTKVTYTLRYDAGGKIPSWIVRSFQSGGTADICEQMRAAAEKL